MRLSHWSAFQLFDKNFRLAEEEDKKLSIRASDGFYQSGHDGSSYRYR
jgi:hypothetical protein